MWNWRRSPRTIRILPFGDAIGRAHMLADQEQTQRQSKPQSGSCLHCHGSLMPLYRELGDGDAMKGSFAWSYKDLNAKLHATRPGFINGIQALAAGEAEVPHLPSVQQWCEGSRNEPYDPNQDATRTEMRSFVCGQCHVEYYCGNKMPLTFPWANGLTADNVESFWNETEFAPGERFYDYKHAESGAEVLKAQHPEFEPWSQGIHAPQEAARVLAEAVDYARQGQVSALRVTGTQ